MLPELIRNMFRQATEQDPASREQALAEKGQNLKASADLIQSRLSQLQGMGKLEVSTKFEAAYDFMELSVPDCYSIILNYVPEESEKDVYQKTPSDLRHELYVYADRFSSFRTPYTRHFMLVHERPGKISEFAALQSVSDWAARKFPLEAAHNIMRTVREIQNTQFEKSGRGDPRPKALA